MRSLWRLIKTAFGEAPKLGSEPGRQTQTSAHKLKQALDSLVRSRLIHPKLQLNSISDSVKFLMTQALDSLGKSNSPPMPTRRHSGAEACPEKCMAPSQRGPR